MKQMYHEVHAIDKRLEKKMKTVYVELLGLQFSCNKAVLWSVLNLLKKPNVAFICPSCFQKQFFLKHLWK